MNKAFKSYDIRGIYNQDFNRNDVYKTGYCLVKKFKTDKVLVGRDVRISTPEIFEALCQGINDAGADVYDIGLATTPMVYYATARYDFSISVQITASHNPKEYNGLKVSGKNALPIGYDTGLKDIENFLESGQVVPVLNKGKIVPFEVRKDYIDFLLKYLPDLNSLNISMDCSNGMAGILVDDIFGNHPHYIYKEPDGTFPNHEANPLEEENVEDLKKEVLKNHSDIGVIFDGDADRVMFVDELGKFIPPDLIIGVMAHYFLEQEKGNVLQDIRTSKSVTEYIRGFGCEMHIWKVGRAHAALKLREINGIYGGELAGHYYFRDFFYSDSGMLAALIVLQVLVRMKEKGLTMSQIIGKIRKYANSGELNFRIEEKDSAIDDVCAYFTAQEKPEKVMNFDGKRLEFSDWWFNIRQSNTEPYLRFIAEAKDEKILKQKISEVVTILKKYQ